MFENSAIPASEANFLITVAPLRGFCEGRASGMFRSDPIGFKAYLVTISPRSGLLDPMQVTIRQVDT